MLPAFVSIWHDTLILAIYVRNVFARIAGHRHWRRRVKRYVFTATQDGSEESSFFCNLLRWPIQKQPLILALWTIPLFEQHIQIGSNPNA